MLFNSLEYLIFLPIVFIIYWLVLGNKINLQNAFLLLISYIFYGWWDYRFLVLIILSSFCDYHIGKLLSKETDQSNRKKYLYLSLLINLGILLFFKYYNFFTESFVDLLANLGLHANVPLLSVILPVGISFYTFQTLSYSIDVYRNKIEAETNWISFFAFVSFFPQLVAGPIERASNLLPQFKRERTVNLGELKDGLRQILFGLFKKIVIADNCAYFVNDIFQNYTEYNSAYLVLGAILFAFQIYGDFSGYSDIAIGSAKLFGIKLMQNFAYPYFARDIAEFWRRWHISLSSWFRDYVYIPLGGSKQGLNKTIRNVFVIFVVSGFWHGANWTFIAWGFLHAVYYLPQLYSKTTRKYLGPVAENNILPNLKEGLQMLSTFLLVCLAWIFFRADSITEAFSYIYYMFTNWGYNVELEYLSTLPLILILLIWEWIQRSKQHGLELSETTSVTFRWSLYLLLIILIFYFNGEKQDFIYFQF